MVGTDDDLGLFGPDSVTWKVHAEPIIGLAGLRALCLQSLHPRAIAGVMQNSGYRADPWGRLERTVIYVATVVYGTTAQARAAGVTLTDEEADRYLDEQRRAAELVGLEPAEVPGSVAQVEEYYREMLPHLRMTKD